MSIDKPQQETTRVSNLCFSGWMRITQTILNKVCVNVFPPTSSYDELKKD